MLWLWTKSTADKAWWDGFRTKEVKRLTLALYESAADADTDWNEECYLIEAEDSYGLD
jgi:hypothetical protein